MLSPVFLSTTTAALLLGKLSNNVANIAFNKKPSQFAAQRLGRKLGQVRQIGNVSNC
jgi:hypothetical protein